jgi:L-seryl-tRNA(Ser) seleniumtransferase
MISADIDQIKARADAWKQALGRGEVVESRSMVGGGSLPGETLPTWVLSVVADHPNRLMEILRKNEPAVVGRVENERVLFDPRTVFPEEDSIFIKALQKAWSLNEK